VSPSSYRSNAGAILAVEHGRVTDKDILDDFNKLQDFFEFNLSQVEMRLRRQIGAVDHRILNKLAELNQRMADVEARMAKLEDLT
jgi:hypothetical protein